MSEFQSSEMWISRELIEEKLPIEHCSLEDFREICKDQKWSVKSYRLGLEGILNSFGIEIDRRKNHIKALVNFLNTKPDKATPKTLGRDIGGKKRKREDTSMVISSDEEEGSHHLKWTLRRRLLCPWTKIPKFWSSNDFYVSQKRRTKVPNFLSI